MWCVLFLKMARRKKTIAKNTAKEREHRKAERAANAENRRKKEAARKAARLLK